MKERNYLIVDFEMCMAKGSARKKMHGERMEIIQIGAVMLDQENRIVDDFSSYVKPEYGKVDAFIEELTGITQVQVDEAPVLRSVLMSFMQWIGERKVTILSWSDADYHQLQMEIQKKKIRDHRVQDLLDEWVDFQRSFDKMLGVMKQSALEDALHISRIHFMGRTHDGLCDAYNTARLFVKVQRQSIFQLELVPICEYEEAKIPLSYSLGELFTPELLAQIAAGEQVEEKNELNIQESTDEKWSVWRKAYRFFRGPEAVTDEAWNRILYAVEMRKLDILDFFRTAKGKKQW